MRERIFAYMVAMLLRNFDPQAARELIDDFLDKLEEKATETETTLDDEALAFVRSVLSIPDDIGGDQD